MKEIGRVAHYKTEKRYGFIQTESGRRIFFHANDWRKHVIGEMDEIKTIEGKLEREPKIGDVFCFDSLREDKGWQAYRWCFKEDLDNLEAFLKKQPIYRVLKQFGGPVYKGRGEPEPKVLWEGKNLRALCKKYPLTDRRSTSTLVYFSHDDGFDISYSFEVSRDNGENWGSCSDPRFVVITPRGFGRR